MARALALIPLCFGLGLLGLGVARSRLPYENERYYDPRTSVVYHLQTAELLLIAGSIVILVGLLIALAAFGFLRRAKESPS